LAQRSSRKRRKKRQRARSEGGDSMARGYARGREKDEAARAALKPLATGERPVAVTVAGVVALVLGVGNVIVYLAGYEIGGERPALVGVLLYSGLMLVAAWGCFNVRYWAVLGMQALLGLSIVLFSLLVIGAKSIVVALVSLVIVALAGTLFWFLVKSMARIQMPERPGS
jgi:hypothetical protein